MAADQYSDAGSAGADYAASALPWDQIAEWGLFLLSAGFIAVGSFFVLAGALGILRMPDFFTRMHAAGMTDTLGAEFILFGLMLQADSLQTVLKLLLVAFFLFLTSPTSSHAIASAAHRSGLKPFLGLYRSPTVKDIEEDARS